MNLSAVAPKEVLLGPLDESGREVAELGFFLLELSLLLHSFLVEDVVLLVVGEVFIS